MAKERSPGFKLFFTCLVAAALVVPLLMTYALLYDRQQQSQTAQDSISAGWGGPQIMVGPVLVIPYQSTSVETFEENGTQKTRSISVTKELYLAPEVNNIKTAITPTKRKKAIYESVLFVANNSGHARFALPADFVRYGIPRDSMNLAAAELRFGVSDARGLQADSKVTVNGTPRELQPGKGLAASGNSGFFTFVDWNGASALEVDYSYAFRGNKSLTMVPRGKETIWETSSSWQSPSFGGEFLPTARTVDGKGFTATHKVTNLALGQAIVTTDDSGPPVVDSSKFGARMSMEAAASPSVSGPSQAASIGLIELVDLYSQVERSVKYGFLFIGFTFLAFLLFDIIAGARVAAAEYLLTGAGLVLFFALLLAFAEVIGFTPAYLLAAGSITGLLTAYSAAVLKSWTRAKVIGALLIGLYAVLYTLLNLEAYALLIGSLLLFAALAAVMWTTRHIDWSGVRGAESGATAADPDDDNIVKRAARKVAKATGTA
jgi:inner membrane protein